QTGRRAAGERRPGRALPAADGRARHPHPIHGRAMRFLNRFQPLALLALRAALGAIMIAHGWPKVFHGGIARTAETVSGWGWPWTTSSGAPATRRRGEYARGGRIHAAARTAPVVARAAPQTLAGRGFAPAARRAAGIRARFAARSPARALRRPGVRLRIARRD